jgi:PAS domain S-box-containing protein
MADHRRLVLLIMIMTGVAFIVGAVALGVFYTASLDRERQRLSNFATGQARLIEVLTPAKVPALLEEQRRLREVSAGRTAELQLARREGDEIQFLTPARESHQPPDPVPFGTDLAEPMARALAGSRGTMIGHDYAGRRVLAAYEPLPALDLGLVVKIDMAEINRHYLQAAMIAALVSLAAVIGAALLFYRLGEPMIGRMRDSEARYRQLVEAQPDPICRFLPDTTLIFVNRAYADFYGQEPDALIGKRWLDFAAKDDRPRFLDELTSFTPQHPDRHEETRSTRADGEVRWYLCHIHGFFDDAGRIQSYQTFATDVTERKRAAEQLARQFALVTAISDSAADAIFVSDDHGRVTIVNPAAERIFGWSHAELAGRVLHDAVHYRRPDGRPYPASDCPIGGVFTTGEAIVGHEDVFFHRDGRPIPVACSNAPLMMGGRISGSVLVARDITKHKQAEEALHQSEARYRAAGEAIRYGVWICNAEGAVEYVSRSFLDLIGKRLDDVVPRGWLDRLPPEDAEPTLRAWRECVRLGADWTREYRVKGTDGDYRTILSLGRPVRDDHERIDSWVGFNLDISRRIEAEEALKESESRMRALLDASQDEILLMATDGTVLAINKAAERRLASRTGGLSPVGAHLDRLLPTEQADERMSQVRHVAQTSTLGHWEVPIRARWFEFWFYPVLPPTGYVTEVAVYAREITEQKRSQAELGKLYQAVQQSPMSVVIADRTGTIEYVNPEFTKVTGYAPSEAIGENPRILKSGHTPAEVYEELWHTISSGGVWRGELLNRKKNGELYWELASIAPVKKGDEITNYVAVKEDITERREIEEQLRQSQKMQAVGQLTGGIAHDFNNLLAIVIGNLALARERVEGDAKTMDYLDDALWSARRGGELTRRLLAFARKQPLNPAIVDLNDVVRGMTELLRRTLGGNVLIEELLEPGLWQAFADRGELERAVVNLAVNAQHAMHGAGTLTLETRNACLNEEYAEQFEEVTPGEYVLLAITDTGAGMTPEISERAFEPFFTTKEAGQGSGLGLSMVYGFVKQSGGHISIYSRVNQGTCVKLYLPRALSPAPLPEDDTADAHAEEFDDKVVLVVEDEAKLRKVAVTTLERLGLRTLQAETAQDALDLMASAHVDVLFTDIELPGGMNGIELADAALDRDPTIKVLFTTGYARGSVSHDRWLDTNVPWLIKPYSHRQLAKELMGLLAGS